MKRVTKSVLAGALFFGLGMAGLSFHTAWADDDEDDHGGGHINRQARRSVAAPESPIYQSECGSCHLAFPSGLLPQRSWEKIMDGLKSHFGENAQLEANTAKQIRAFLVAGAADHSSLRRSTKIAKSIPKDESPIRITETNYFKRQHHEVGKSVFSRRSIGSAANCAACHPQAERGIFSEDEIRVPR